MDSKRDAQWLERKKALRKETDRMLDILLRRIGADGTVRAQDAKKEEKKK